MERTKDLLPFLAVTVLLLLSAGCSPEGSGVFCNPLKTPVTVTVSSTVDRVECGSVVVLPGEAAVIRGLRGVDMVSIRIDRLGISFSRRVHIADSGHIYSAPGEHEWHYLVTVGEVYRIPRTLRGKWRANVNSIQLPAARLPDMVGRDERGQCLTGAGIQWTSNGLFTSAYLEPTNSVSSER